MPVISYRHIRLAVPPVWHTGTVNCSRRRRTHSDADSAVLGCKLLGTAALLGLALSALIVITGQDIRMPGPELQFDCNDFPGQCRDYPFPYGYLIAMLLLIIAVIGLWVALARQLTGSWSWTPLLDRSAELSDQSRRSPTRSRTTSQWVSLVVDVALCVVAPPILAVGGLALAFGGYAAALGFAGVAGVLLALVFALTTSIQTRTTRPAWIAGGAVALTAIIAVFISGIALLFTGPGLFAVPVIGIVAMLLARAAAYESIRENSAVEYEGGAPSSAIIIDEGDPTTAAWRPIARCAAVVCTVAGIVSVSALMILPAPADRSTPIDQTPPASSSVPPEEAESGAAVAAESGAVAESGGEATPAVEPLCSPDSLTAELGPVQGALGARGAILTVINNGDTACSVSGVPDLQITMSGADLAVSTVASPRASAAEFDRGVDIPAGASAAMQLSWRGAGTEESDTVDMTLGIAGGEVPVDVAQGQDGGSLDMETGTQITCEPWR